MNRAGDVSSIGFSSIEVLLFILNVQLHFCYTLNLLRFNLKGVNMSWMFFI